MYYRSYGKSIGTYSNYDGKGLVPSEMDPFIRQIYEENKRIIDRAYAQAIEIRDTLY